MKEAIIGQRIYIFSNAAEALDFSQYWHHHHYVPMVGLSNYPLFWTTADKLTNDVKLAIGLLDAKTYLQLQEYCIEPPRVPQGLFLPVARKILE